MNPPKEPLPDRIWLTRDTVQGVLEDVDVWSSKPPVERYEDGDVFFGLDAVDETHLGQWPIAEAKKRYAGAPDSSREVICIGREPKGD